MTKKPTIILFRQDLRLKDNPALTHACHSGNPIIPLYILDDEIPGIWKIGKASRWWLHYSLLSLQESLHAHGSQLVLFKGDTFKILSALIDKHNVGALYWNRCYEPYAIKLEKKFNDLQVQRHSYNGSLLFEPWDIYNNQNTPFKVFTPFWKKCLEVESIDDPLPAPSHIITEKITSEPLESFQLLQGEWNVEEFWQVGEKIAHRKLKHFIDHSLNAYDHGRDIPSQKSTSELSPHLHFGEISPRQIFHALKHIPNRAKFLSEIGWREFSYYQLYHFPKLPEVPWRAEFSTFPWENNPDFFKKWQKGETGYPIVDAGMRQLLKTGWMHNRVRMIVASFLVKDLFIHWQEGARWFWDALVDADLANNSASWQWVAGCGFDAAPFFRIFNPTLQGEKFDPEGTYVKQWIPELRDVPKNFVHKPWEAGWLAPGNYPAPIISHEGARKKALRALKMLTEAS